jgi:hypothetical protein
VLRHHNKREINMSNFNMFRDAVNAKIAEMEGSVTGLLKSATGKEMIWDTYLAAFPVGTNPIYLTNTVHDCNCCKSFIRDLGRAVSVNEDLELQTIWDIEIEDETYQAVADSLAKLVRSNGIEATYQASSLTLNTQSNYGTEEKMAIEFDHFYYDLDSKYKLYSDAPSFVGRVNNNFNVLSRGLKELTVDALEIVKMLIEGNDLYLGEQNLRSVSAFLELKKDYDVLIESKKENFLWVSVKTIHASVATFRNSAIGTLVIDLSEGVSLDGAVASYESKVAPSNYKRSSAPVTKAMIQKAEKKVKELGFEDSLERTHATLDDISINDVLWANRSTTSRLIGSVFDELIQETEESVDKDKAKKVSLSDFLDGVVPNANSMKLLLTNDKQNNLMSLVSPKHKDSKNMLKWSNNFTWSYNGSFSDSVAERVKKKGGNIGGDVRISLSWFNKDDLDLSLETPSGKVVAFYQRSSGGFQLDVDENAGGKLTDTPVENIFANALSDISQGTYKVIVKNFRKRTSENTGFGLDFVVKGGETINLSCNKSPKDGEDYKCFSFKYSKEKGIEVLSVNPNMQMSSQSQEVWGLTTNKLQEVSSLMFSPNHWDENEVGNRHVFFMLEGCKNPDAVRGFYNEYLTSELHEDRKVFEVLASKMVTKPTNKEQLSGLGISTTKKGETIYVQVVNNTGTKLYKVVV